VAEHFDNYLCCIKLFGGSACNDVINCHGLDIADGRWLKRPGHADLVWGWRCGGTENRGTNGVTEPGKPQPKPKHQSRLGP